jgi:hypothetical protein
MDQLITLLLWIGLIAYVVKVKTGTMQLHLLAAWAVIGGSVVYALGRLVVAALS